MAACPPAPQSSSYDLEQLHAPVGSFAKQLRTAVRRSELLTNATPVFGIHKDGGPSSEDEVSNRAKRANHAVAPLNVSVESHVFPVPQSTTFQCVMSESNAAAFMNISLNISWFRFD